jgi:hypothetical protein
VTLQQLLDVYRFGTPGACVRLAEWLDINVLPSDRAAFLALVDYYWPGTRELLSDAQILGEEDGPQTQKSPQPPPGVERSQ